MKIYYVVSSLEGGGAEFVIPDIVDVFTSLGHCVTVLACKPQDMQTAALLEKRNIPYQLLSLNGDSRFRSLYNLLKLIKRSPPDLIWTSLARGTIDGQLAGLFSHIPVVSWKHSSNLLARNLPKIRLTQGLSKLWVADSSGVVNFLQEHMNVTPDRIMTWPIFQVPPNLPAILPWTGEGIFHIGGMARLTVVKGFDIMIKSIQYINQKYPEVGQRIKLSIAGSGVEEQHLRDLIRDLQLSNVEMLGFRQDVMQYLKTLHLYVQNSTYEGLCIAVHEALAIGLPVISTDVGEMQVSIRKNPIGTLLPERSVEALGEAIVDYFHNPEKTRIYGENAKKYIATHYSSEAFRNAGKAILDRVEVEILPHFKD